MVYYESTDIYKFYSSLEELEQITIRVDENTFKIAIPLNV